MTMNGLACRSLPVGRQSRTHGVLYRLSALALLLAALFGCDPCPDDQGEWSVAQNGQVLEIAYGKDGDFPQFAALHLNDSYFRMIPTADSGWGTSVVIMPSFWSGGMLYQGAPVSCLYNSVGSDLSFVLRGIIATLNVTAEIRLSPPLGDSISAYVSLSVAGDIALDDRPGEAFKLVMLSSMHDSSAIWDCSSAFAGLQTYEIPLDGWINQPPALVSLFGLRGGTSSWKTNAPTIEVRLDRDAAVTGWVTPSVDPNNDNVGYWGASNELIRTWGYQLMAKR